MIRNYFSVAIIGVLFLSTFPSCLSDNSIRSLSDSSIRIPGELVGEFSIALRNDVLLNLGYASSPNMYPLIVWVSNLDMDPWSATSLLANKSIDLFLTSNMNLGSSHYLFLAASEIRDIERLQAAFESRRKALGISNDKMDRILYGNKTVKDLKLSNEANKITKVLDVWKSYVKHIQISYQKGGRNETFNITRLDGYWPYAHSPYDSTNLFRLLDGGDGCARNLTRSMHNSPYYLLITANNCTYEEAAERADISQATGALVMMKEADILLKEINEDASVPLENAEITSISYEDGLLLQRTIAESDDGAEVTVSFYHETIPGYFFVIDSQGAMQEIGSHSSATLMVASWASQYENYKQNLHSNLSKPAYVIPILDRQLIYTASKVVTLPEEIRGFGKLAIDTTITCEGLFDSDCSHWDHTVTISVSCADNGNIIEKSNLFQVDLDGADDRRIGQGLFDRKRKLEVGGARFEIARYVTPFGRRVGRWLTDITPLIPLLTDPHCEEKLFQASVGGERWIISSNLRFSEWGLEPPKSYSSLYSSNQPFNTAYNEDRKLSIAVPNKGNIRRVQLEAIITTHGSDEYGCCEFLPTAHIFSVNGHEFNLTFDKAGTPWGCSDMAAAGSVPNEYGTWWYGRGGWCDGMDVQPWVVDVTPAILLGKREGKEEEKEVEKEEGDYAEINYKAMMQSPENGTWIYPQSASQSGYVIISSNLVYYYSENESVNTSHASNVSGVSKESSSSHVLSTQESVVIIMASFTSLFFILFIGICIHYRRVEHLEGVRSSQISMELLSQQEDNDSM
eukprot:CAMPEP_0119036222 /NCGR_PEP_ID=MMETSP1177-20130426/3780_1 /TAXON_ID=2985 /ORGANISM="Ochromonas sp, Strain CCMP1899" /LENGTH=795 /DNA_ID=CAMNT_0006995731 /DNA_START=83 /DNA_END=2470 /DNA_ORIENTATION=-